MYNKPQAEDRNLFGKYTELVPIIYDKLRSRTPFAFSRWGDGEWLTVSQDDPQGSNCDGNKYYSGLGARLRSILESRPSYFMGHQNVKGYTKKEDYPQDWVNSDFLHELSMAEGLSSFIEVLQPLHVVYIGNSHLSKLSFVDEFITIPPSNVWDIYPEVLREIKTKIAPGRHKTFLFSAGMAAEVFIDDLWNSNKENTYMDVGSVFDPHVGRFSRRYHFTLGLPGQGCRSDFL